MNCPRGSAHFAHDDADNYEWNDATKLKGVPIVICVIGSCDIDTNLLL